MLDCFYRPSPDDDVRASRKDRRDERGDVGCAVLVVRVRVHNDVRAELKGGLQARHVRARQSLVPFEADDVIHAAAARHFHRIVRAPVVDNKPFHLIKSLHDARQLRQRNRESGAFVIAGNLDDELHCAVSFMYVRR